MCTLSTTKGHFFCTAGSQFRNPGLFEVTQATKAEDSAEQSMALSRALEVTVGSDLEGKAELRVAIVTSGEQIETATVRGKYSNSFLSPVMYCKVFFWLVVL